MLVMLPNAGIAKQHTNKIDRHEIAKGWKMPSNQIQPVNRAVY